MKLKSWKEEGRDRFLCILCFGIHRVPSRLAGLLDVANRRHRLLENWDIAGHAWVCNSPELYSFFQLQTCGSLYVCLIAMAQRVHHIYVFSIIVKATKSYGGCAIPKKAHIEPFFASFEQRRWQPGCRRVYLHSTYIPTAANILLPRKSKLQSACRRWGGGRYCANFL